MFKKRQINQNSYRLLQGFHSIRISFSNQQQNIFYFLLMMSMLRHEIFYYTYLGASNKCFFYKSNPTQVKGFNSKEFPLLQQAAEGDPFPFFIVHF